MNETGWRGSAETWLAAAYDDLIASGVDAVKIQPLAKRLGVARTSFYWFFADRQALLTALLERWREQNTGSLIRRTEAYAETVSEAILNLFDCWLDGALFDSRLEFAVRSWALQSQDVAEAIAEADAVRLAAFAAMFRRHGFEALTADVRARTVYLTQIGYIAMKTEEDLELRLTRIADYVEIFCGRPPSRSELARFEDRHRRRVAALASEAA